MRIRMFHWPAKSVAIFDKLILLLILFNISESGYQSEMYLVDRREPSDHFSINYVHCSYLIDEGFHTSYRIFIMTGLCSNWSYVTPVTTNQQVGMCVAPNENKTVNEGDVTKAICSRITGLSTVQREICASHPDAMVAVGDGIHLAMSECQKQFREHRWNCTLVGKRNTFGYIILVGSREASFIYAITSAAITYTIASACSKGNINGCGCEISRRPKKQYCRDCHGNKSHSGSTAYGHNKNTWKWSGCSVNVDYAAKFTRKFLDAREIEGDARSLMNLHNNKVGRRAVKQNLRTDCKCHGMSGSCSLKTCWKTLPYFKIVSNYLMEKYWKANGVTVAPASVSQSRNVLNISLTKPHSKRSPTNNELVFLEQSPNYCEKDTHLGSLGTVGRICNRSSTGMDGCDLLCCGRGYNIRQYIKQWQCRCKFFWCCYVTCDICTEKSEQYICK